MARGSLPYFLANPAATPAAWPTMQPVVWFGGLIAGSALLMELLLSVLGVPEHFIAADYAMGASVVRDASDVIKRAGASVVGSVRHPFPGTRDFSSYLLQAQASGANVICLANAGDDLSNTVKQAKEFGIERNGTVLTAMLMDVPTVRAIGLEQGQGLYYSNTFYWDRTDGTRVFTERLIALIAGATFNLLTPIMALLALLTNVTAVQRILYTRRIARDTALR